MEIKLKHYQGVNKTIRKLNIIRRWTGTMTDPRYDEISKQTLNCILCFFLAKENERRGNVVKWDRIVKTAIYRAFQKAYIFYDTPEHIYKEICAIGNIPYEQEMEKATHKIIVKQTDEDFANLIEECLNTSEKEMYEAATKIATYFEFEENDVISKSKKKELILFKSLEKFEHIDGFLEIRDNYEEVFKICSRLRNQNRWAGHGYRVSCAVSGHLFDTAIFGFLNALEKKYNEEEASKIFFIGLFHDIAETFTRDIPSPVKNGIKGFREASEKYELQMMEKEFYPKLPDYMAKAVKGVMMEEEANANYKSICKVADYISAASEIYRQCPDESWNKAINKHDKTMKKKFKDEIGENALIFFSEMRDRINREFSDFVEFADVEEFDE